MNQYEVELERKSKDISRMDSEQQAIIQENSDLSQQLYVLRTKFSPDGAQIGDGTRILTADEEKIQTIQKDQMVELLKRNHDVLMEKYELVRRQHDALERSSMQKEELFNKMQAETEQLRTKAFDLEKATAELANQRALLERELRAVEQGAKAKDDSVKALTAKKDKFEGSSKVLAEQLEVIQNSYDDLAAKKAHEIDLLSKEVHQLGLKEKDTRQQLQWAENELNELKDQVRTVTNELDTRT
jgi:chromosome segregation ATPase